MKELNCPKCQDKMMIDIYSIRGLYLKSIKYYKCNKCLIIIAEPGVYYKNMWSMVIDSINHNADHETIWINEKTLEQCIKKYKLSAFC